MVWEFPILFQWLDCALWNQVGRNLQEHWKINRHRKVYQKIHHQFQNFPVEIVERQSFFRLRPSIGEAPHNWIVWMVRLRSAPLSAGRSGRKSYEMAKAPALEADGVKWKIVGAGIRSHTHLSFIQFYFTLESGWFSRLVVHKVLIIFLVSFILCSHIQQKCNFQFSST